MTDFPFEIVDEQAHRPWPMPDGPWIMTQSWHDLLFAHWPVDRRALEAKLPPMLQLDLFEGQAWLGITPFHLTNVAPRGVPALPLVSAFPELNVRAYVRIGDKPGVYFFSLDAGNPLADGATLYRGDIHHPPWPLQRAEAEIEINTMAAAAGIRLPSMKPLLHFSRRQDVVVWPLAPVS